VPMSRWQTVPEMRVATMEFQEVGYGSSRCQWEASNLQNSTTPPFWELSAWVASIQYPNCKGVYLLSVIFVSVRMPRSKLSCCIVQRAPSRLPSHPF